MVKVSVVISTRDEGHNLTHTIHSFINDLETWCKRDEWEIIVVHNCPTQDEGWRFLMERGLFYQRNVRVLFDPIAGNVSARNKGAAIARGRLLIFSDAHMAIRPGTTEKVNLAVEKYGGIVHVPVQWMGGYEPASPSYQYSIKIGEKLWGTWNHGCVADTFFYIPGSGHCFFGVSRQEFTDLGGYHTHFRCYGGGELYLALKWWMLGSTVGCEPSGLVYHLSAGRGYSYHQHDLIHNMMLCAYSLGLDALAERVFISYKSVNRMPEKLITQLRDEAWQSSQADRQYIFEKLASRPYGIKKKESGGIVDSVTPSAEMLASRPYGDVTFPRSGYAVLAARPWDARNLDVHGSAVSHVVVYDGTWRAALPYEAGAAVEASALQRSLARFFNERMPDAAYQSRGERRGERVGGG